MVCLDTSVVVDFLKGESGAVEAVQGKIEGGDIISVASITAHEILFGSIFYKPKELKETESFLDSVTVLDFDIVCAKISSEIRVGLMKKGKALGIFDTLIAATAIANNERLITKDKAFQSINRSALKVGDEDITLDIEII